MRVGVGIDLVEVEDVRRALDAHGERYLRRVYTDRERRAADGRPDRLAGIFAAKEAALKALGIAADAPLVWRDVEIGGGRATLRGRLAGAQPPAEVSVSRRDGRGRTPAVAVALVTRPG